MKTYYEKKIKIIFFMLIFGQTTNLYSFTNIEQAILYAQQHNEYPKQDNDNLAAPDYTTFHQGQVPGFFSSIAQKIGLTEKPLWTAQEFKKLLEEVTANREKRGYQGPFVEKIEPKAQDNIILIGELSGAFHSLARILQELVRQGIMNEQFKIIKQNTYIVFNRDGTGLSPYVLETLTLILDVMKQNPDRAFCLGGQNDEVWQHAGLKQALEVRAYHISSEKIPLKSLVDRFYSTLPLALYISANTDDTKQFIRISPLHKKANGLPETNFGNFFSQRKKPDIYLTTQNIPVTKPPAIKAIINTQENLTANLPTKGLLVLKPDQDVITWALFSSPTTTNRTLYGFVFDAFAVIHITEQIKDWTISLYNRDIRELKGFAKTEEFNLITGKKITQETAPSTPEKKAEAAKIEQKSSPEPTAPTSSTPTQPPVESTKTINNNHHEIVIGATLDLSKALGIQGKDVYFGMTKAIERANKEGGINGAQIRLIALDDEDNPTLARENIQKLKKDHHTDIILSPLQATSIKGYLDLIRNGEILMLFPCTGSMEFAGEEYKYAVTNRTWYVDIDILALLYPRKALGVKRTAYFVPDDGLDSGLERHLQSTKVPAQDYKLMFYNPSLLELATSVKTIIDYDPDIIVLYGSIQASLELLRQIGPDRIGRKKFIAEEFDSALFHEFIDTKGLKNKFYDIENLPNSEISDLPIVVEYRTEIGTTKPNSFSLRGYVNASLFIELARMTKGPITKESILATAQGLNNYDFKGFRLTYKNQQLFKKVWINEGNPEWIEVDIDELIKTQQ